MAAPAQAVRFFARRLGARCGARERVTFFALRLFTRTLFSTSNRKCGREPCSNTGSEAQWVRHGWRCGLKAGDAADCLCGEAYRIGGLGGAKIARASETHSGCRLSHTAVDRAYSPASSAGGRAQRTRLIIERKMNVLLPFCYPTR